MKNITLSILIVLTQTLLFAQCPPGDLIIFSSQAQINEFQTYYPNCTELDADVVISGGSIVNLYGLNKITSITGNLSFLYNQTLYNLQGLESLTSVGGNLVFLENYVMLNLTGLQSVSSVGGDLVISTNNLLNSLNGLNNLTTIGGDFYVGYNAKVDNFTGFDNLVSVGNSLQVEHCSVLSSLMGLESLVSVGGSLLIEYNDTLASLTALEALTSIGGDLSIRSNYALNSLSGLDNIDAASINNLSFYSNTSLSSCEVISVCTYLADPNGGITILNNATGCKNKAEVEAACELVSVYEQKQRNSLSIYPNPAYSIITIDLANTPSQNAFLTISNTSGQQLITQIVSDSKTQIDISRLPKGIYIVKMQLGKDLLNRKLVVN